MASNQQVATFRKYDTRRKVLRGVIIGCTVATFASLLAINVEAAHHASIMPGIAGVWGTQAMSWTAVGLAFNNKPKYERALAALGR